MFIRSARLQGALSTKLVFLLKVSLAVISDIGAYIKASMGLN